MNSGARTRLSHSAIVRSALIRATVIQVPLTVLAWTRYFGLTNSGCMHPILIPCVPYLLQLPGSILSEVPYDWLEHNTLWRLRFGHVGLEALSTGVTQFLVLVAFFVGRGWYRNRRYRPR